MQSNSYPNKRAISSCLERLKRDKVTLIIIKTIQMLHFKAGSVSKETLLQSVESGSDINLT